MANGSGFRGIQSRWDDGDLVFETLAGVEVLRLAAAGSATLGGLAITGGTGTVGQVLTANGDGTASFETPV